MTSYINTIDEIIALYELEPELCDIYVEGITDQLVIKRFIDKYDIYDVNVKLIEDIDFNSICEKYPNIKRNNKEKLITLSKEISKNDELEKINKLTIIIDKDFDEINQTMISNKYVKYTDYNSLELYLYNESVIDNFYSCVLRRFPFNGNKTITVLSPLLQDCFIISAVFHEENIGKSDRVDYSNSIKIDKKNCRIDFSLDEHLKKDLNKLSKSRDLISYLEKIEEKKQKLHCNIKNNIRGHDFFEILFLFIDKVSNSIKLNHFIQFI